jgi:PAS domain S-box-containing protein
MKSKEEKVNLDSNSIDIKNSHQQTNGSIFQSFLESVPDAIVIINNDGNIESVNSQTEKMFGYTKKEILGNKVELLMSSRYKMIHQSHRDGYFKAPKVRTMGEGMVLFAQNKKGEEFPVEISLSKLNSEDNFLVCASIRDVSKQKKIESELIDAKIKAENAAKSKQQFLSNMSHEIRTPMNAIIGFTNVVLKTDLSEKQREYLAAIKTSCDALTVLINDIIDLAKVETEKIVFEKKPFKLATSISAMSNLFEPKIQEKNLNLIIEYDNNIPDVLIGDPVRLHQIILNLVGNAVKFTLEGKIIISVRKLFEDHENIEIEFSITDTGIGIEKEKVDTIFENFHQAHSDVSKIYGGTGLGLAIVKQLIGSQGGHIQMESEFGKGTIFRFVLSFQKANEETVFEEEIIELESSEVKNIKILVVEDVKLNQLLIKTLLDDFGFEYDIVANGKLAIQKLEINKYDIILMDMLMPIMNGYEATEYIRNTMKSQIPIIALTADVSTFDLQKSKILGMNDYVSKPINEKILYNKIVGIIKKQLQNMEHEALNKLQNNDLKYTDLKYLKKITKSDSKLMIEMIDVYLKQTPTLVNAMKQSLFEKDSQMLQAAVHKMIPSFAIMGINEDIEIMAKKVQEYAHTIEISEEIHKMVLEIEKVCAKVCQELEDELINLKN